MPVRSRTDHTRVHRHAFTWVILFGVIALMFLRLPAMVARQDSVLRTYADLVEVDSFARREYVEVIDDDRLVHGAIRGMMLQLDPYSGYIPPEELPAFERRSSGDYPGVGVELGLRDGKPTVIAAIDGTPAAEADVRSDDVILAINEVDVENRSIFEIEDMLVGEVGTKVRLRVRSRGDRAPRTLTLVRRPIRVESVRGLRRDEHGHWNYWVDPDWRMGYIRISNFRQNTSADFERVLAKLVEAGASALVLDLRFNPGGLMHQGIAVADCFLAEGLILSTVTRRLAVDEYWAHAPGTVENMELSILVNQGTASAAEIVAGSLQARKRAAVVGERTFGKGSVQDLIHLEGHKAAIKLTIAYYRLPDGRIIHRTPKNATTDAWGVIPDVVVVPSAEEKHSIEQSFRAHRDSNVEREPSSATQDDPQKAPLQGNNGNETPELRDPQLAAAVDLLRARLASRASEGRTN